MRAVTRPVFCGSQPLAILPMRSSTSLNGVDTNGTLALVDVLPLVVLVPLGAVPVVAAAAADESGIGGKFC